METGLESHVAYPCSVICPVKSVQCRCTHCSLPHLTINPKRQHISATYLPPPATHCDSRLRPGSCERRTRRRPRRVCSSSRVRFAERRGSRWAGASGGIEDLLDPSPRARRPCTIPPSESASPPLCSWGWPAHPSTRSDRTGAPRSGGVHPLIWVGNLVERQIRSD